MIWMKKKQKDHIFHDEDTAGFCISVNVPTSHLMVLGMMMVMTTTTTTMMMGMMMMMTTTTDDDDDDD